MGVVLIKEFNKIEAICLITIWYFRNSSSISILFLVLYWARNNILSGVDFNSIGNQHKVDYNTFPSLK